MIPSPLTDMIAEAYSVLYQLLEVTVSFADAEGAGLKDEDFIARREELTALLEKLDAKINGYAASRVAETDQSAFVEFCSHKTTILSDIMARDEEIIRVSEGKLSTLAEEMTALQAGKQAMHGYRREELPGVFVNRTA